jgi:hypothetical protein
VYLVIFLLKRLCQDNFLVKKTGGVAQVVERLLSKREALNSNPSNAKKRKKQNKTVLMNYK